MNTKWSLVVLIGFPPWNIRVLVKYRYFGRKEKLTHYRVYPLEQCFETVRLDEIVTALCTCQLRKRVCKVWKSLELVLFHWGQKFWTVYYPMELCELHGRCGTRIHGDSTLGSDKCCLVCRRFWELSEHLWQLILVVQINGFPSWKGNCTLRFC